MAEKFEIITFKDGEFALDVRADKNGETVWLTQREIAQLFLRDPTKCYYSHKKYLSR